MKLWVKILTFVFTAVLVASLFGCVPQAAEGDPTLPVQAPADQQPADTQPVEPLPVETQPVEQQPEATQPEAPQSSEPGAPVTIRYANWNLGTEEENNLQRQMVKAYTDQNPHVTVEFVDMSGEGGWEAILTAYAAKGELPDVFMANNVPLYVQNGWVADLSEFTQNDPDWPKIPEVLRDAVTYDGKVLGLPAAQFVMGYFVNKDLYEAANLDAPEYGFTVQDFDRAVTSLNDIDKGVLGLDEMEFVVGWYPNTVDPNLKWFSFDGEKMNYNSAAFKQAIAKAGEVKPYTWQGLSEEQLGNFKSTGPWELFLNQEVGMRWDGSWSVPNYVENATFEWDFIGFPGGNQALVADIMVVSATTNHLEESYNFAKWMTFSSEAYATEIELARALGTAPKMPVAVDADAIAAYEEFVSVPGIIQAIDNLDNSVVESLAKIVPGYINARWEGKPGIDIGDERDVNMWFMFNFANDGRYKYEDYSEQLEAFANRILSEASTQMNQ